MQRLNDDEFDFLHSWIWDRTRAIRKDLRTQRIEQRSDITVLLTCLERSARFLILSTHQMARTTKEDYSHQQDIEQLNQTLMSLKERYVDNRRVGYPSENEPEFWAYRLILAPLFTNAQFENELHCVPSDIRHNPRVKTAIEIYRAMKSVIFTKSTSFIQSQANWKLFWDLIKSTRVSYLMACAAEVSFQRVRHVVLDTLWRVYRIGTTSRPQTVDTWTIEKVRDALGFDTDAEAVKLCEAYGFGFKSTNAGTRFLDVTAKGFARVPLALAPDISPQIFSQGIVECKRYNRAFSAVVQAMSVQQARQHGLLVNSIHEGMEDETSLFVPEGPASQPNIFKQAKSGPESVSALNPTTNPFLPKSTISPSMGGAPNPFKPAINPTPQAAAPNPFIPKPSLPSVTLPGVIAGGAQPGLFDASKNAIKFGPTATSTTPSLNSDKPNPFLPTAQAAPATPSTATTNVVSSPGFNLFTQNAATTAQKPASMPSSTSIPAFSFPGVSKSGDQGQISNPAISFTPAGSPAPAAPTPQDAGRQKAEEEAQRLKAEAEAEAQRQQRAREEQERQAIEAERQRVEAENHQRRLQEEEHNRILQEMQEQRRREDEARAKRQVRKERGYDSMATDAMFDAEEGLMMQFVEELTDVTTAQIVAAEEEKQRQRLWEKRRAVADAMYEQRTLGLKRAVMAKWIERIEKKKRDLKARDRRRRLKEMRANMAVGVDPVQNAPMPAEPDAVVDLPPSQIAFQKPQMPASARRAKRTEERRRIPSSPAPDMNSRASKSEQQTAFATLTPISMGSSHRTPGEYSEAYHKSTAPIDRTEGDYFKLRAEGLDPNRLRKRSFGSPSDEEPPNIEPKRPKMSLSTTMQPSVQTSASTTADRRSRLDAIEQSHGRSAGLTQAATDATSFDGRSSSNKRSSLIEQAKQVLDRTRSTRVQNHFGQSVPNSHRRAISLQQSTFGKSTGTPTTGARAAYWDRPSRFVPKPVYGQGPDAVRAYRQQFGLSSLANTRPNSTEPLAVLSPIPRQLSYKPANGYTPENYSDEEDSSGIEAMDLEAEDDNTATTEDEYEGDEENEDEEHLNLRQSRLAQNYDDEDDDELQYSNGYTHGQHSEEVLEDYESYSDEDEEEDDEEDDNQYAQGAQFIQTSHGKQPQQIAGSTEDDAIELSD
jgi:hypothetical protein